VIGCVASSALIAFYLIFPGFALGYVNTRLRRSNHLSPLTSHQSLHEYAR
jgi:hypothetical protein